MSALLHDGENGEALPSASISFPAGCSDGQVSPHAGSGKNNNDAEAAFTLISPPLDDESSDDETGSVGSWMSYGARDEDARFLAAEIEEIPSPRWRRYLNSLSPSQGSKPAAVNLEEIKVDNEVLDGILEHLLEAAGLKRVSLSDSEVWQLCAACGDSVVASDLHSYLKVYEKLWGALFVKLANLEKLINADTNGTLKLDAGVDELTRCVVDELRFTCKCWRKLLEAHTSSKASGHEVPIADKHEETTQRFLKELMNVADLVVKKLRLKSELYKGSSQRYIFLMNNWNHIAVWAGSNELPKEWCKIWFRGIEQLYHIQYLREVWGELVTWLKDQALRYPLERVTKEKMESFNKMFEKAVQSQRSLVVSSEGGMRANLKLLILAQLLQPYRRFVDRYQMMEKRPKCFEYTPEDIEVIVDGLFGGSEPSVEHSSGKSGRNYDTDASQGTGKWFSPPPLMVIGATGLSGSNCRAVPNDKSRVDSTNEGENISSSKPSNPVPSDTVVSPLVDEALTIAVASGTGTDNQWSEGQATAVTEHIVPPTNSQTSASDLGGLGHQDSEELSEPVNNYCRHQIEEKNPSLLPAPLGSTPTPVI